ncbi:radical SAM protein [Patescibacteria group bacterium]|nr:radical SAM protein [Patescibacteria group bacterium]
MKSFFISKDFYKRNPLLQNIRTIQFEVTNHCNLNCSICWRTLRKESPQLRSVSFEQFKMGLDKILTMFNIQELNSQGLGEPFLCPDILKILHFTKLKGLTVWLVSNGTLIDDFIAEELVEAGIDKIRISIDSANPQLYARIKSNSTLDKVMQNIHRLNTYKYKLKKNSPILSFNTVVLKSTFPGLEALINLANKIGVKEITLIPLVVFSGGMPTIEEQVDFYSKDFQQSFKRLKDKAQELAVELNLGISLETKETKFCHYGMYMDVRGFVYPCCNISSLKFGNIYRQHIKQIASNYLKFRNWLDKKQIICKECNNILESI